MITAVKHTHTHIHNYNYAVALIDWLTYCMTCCGWCEYDLDVWLLPCLCLSQCGLDWSGCCAMHVNNSPSSLPDCAPCHSDLLIAGSDEKALACLTSVLVEYCCAMLLSSCCWSSSIHFFCFLWYQRGFHFKCSEILHKTNKEISHESLIKISFKLVGMLLVFGSCLKKKGLKTMIPRWQALLSLNGLLNDLIKVV